MGQTLDQKIRQLCDQAAKEQDTDRLIALVKTIIDTSDAEREPKECVKGSESQADTDLKAPE